MAKPYDQFPTGSPELVVAHGLSKIKRGRQPSLSFRGIKNPRLAFQIAQSILNGEEVVVLTFSQEQFFVSVDNSDKFDSGSQYPCTFYNGKQYTNNSSNLQHPSNWDDAEIIFIGVMKPAKQVIRLVDHLELYYDLYYERRSEENIEFAELYENWNTDFPEEVITKLNFRDMSDSEFKEAVKEIIKTSDSEEMVKTRLKEELDYPYSIAITSSQPTTKVGREARVISSMLGGLTLQNGAMVMVMMNNKDGKVLSL